MTVSSGLRFALAKRADELLADGEWHNYEKVTRELMKLVPPGPAHRRMERDRRIARARRADEMAARGAKPTGPRQVELDRTLVTGQRRIAREFLGASSAYELDRPGIQQRTAEAAALNRQRQIRMVAKHMALRGDPYRIERDQLRYENEVLRERLDRFIAYLKDAGHAEAIDGLIAGPEVPP